MKNPLAPIEKAPRPKVSEEFIVKATIEDEKSEEFVVRFTGCVDDCNNWLYQISGIFSVLQYEIVLVNAVIIME